MNLRTLGRTNGHGYIDSAVGADQEITLHGQPRLLLPLTITYILQIDFCTFSKNWI